jgi:hypothetical protein
LGLVRCTTLHPTQCVSTLGLRLSRKSPHHITPHHATPHHTTPHHTIPHTILHNTALHCTDAEYVLVLPELARRRQVVHNLWRCTARSARDTVRLEHTLPLTYYCLARSACGASETRTHPNVRSPTQKQVRLPWWR